MKKTVISVFGAKCGALLERVRKPKAPRERSAWIGSMGDSIEILGDVISPANEEREWEALRD
jgi:hypothetical protein